MTPRTRRIALACLLLAPPGACGHRPLPGAARAKGAKDGAAWQDWLVLGPVVKAARIHASGPVADAIAAAGALLAEGKVREADGKLARLAGTGSNPWAVVARADLAAFYFTACIRGVALRLSDTRPGEAPAATRRERIFDPEARVEPDDLSVEVLLSGLDRAAAMGVPELTVHAKMARARIAAYVTACPANETVARRADEVMRADLAELAAAGRLAPDLAFMWAGIQMAEYSGAAARPFLLAAREGGFDDPSLSLMLAVAEKDAGDLAAARRHAAEAAQRFRTLGDRPMQAEVAYLQGEIDAAAGRRAQAAASYRRALSLDPLHVGALLGWATQQLVLEGEGSAVALLSRELGRRFHDLGAGDDPLPAGMRFGEKLVLAAGPEPALVQALRDALLSDVDAESAPAARGLRYFFAATLDARLAEYDRAAGHALVARREFEEAGEEVPQAVEEFLASLPEGVAARAAAP